LSKQKRSQKIKQKIEETKPFGGSEIPFVELQVQVLETLEELVETLKTPGPASTTVEVLHEIRNELRQIKDILKNKPQVTKDKIRKLLHI